MLPFVELAPPLREAMRRAFVAAAPREFVGLLGGVREVHRVRLATCTLLPNVAAGEHAFVVPAAAFATAEAELRARGEAWLGFVHSHPFAAARPSQADRRQLWRDCVQLIGGGAPDAPHWRAWWLSGAEPTAHELTIAGLAPACVEAVR